MSNNDPVPAAALNQAVAESEQAVAALLSESAKQIEASRLLKAKELEQAAGAGSMSISNVGLDSDLLEGFNSAGGHIGAQTLFLLMQSTRTLARIETLLKPKSSETTTPTVAPTVTVTPTVTPTPTTT